MAEALEGASQGWKQGGPAGEEAAGFMSPEFRGQGLPRDRSVGGVSCLGHSFPNDFIPGKGPAPPRESMLPPPGPLPTCPLSLRRSRLLGRVGTSAPSTGAPELASSLCVGAPHRTPSDKIPPSPLTLAKCHRRNVVAAGPESQGRNTQDTYVRLGSAS